ncbi:MAG: phosphonate ABC transporter ATP-binding protein [Oscillochloris sp.]|nr:phosphonate ABC transporter ATP-binding protein [Oscillochloris sp.]
MLDIRDLAMVYANGHRALNSVSFRIEQGEIVAIIGRSGAGKSTLLRCINGLERPSAGTIRFGDQQITGMDDRQLERLRSRIGFIWQEYNLIERLPVLTNVLTGRLGYNRGFKSFLGYFDRQHREIALRNLERVNLLSHAVQRADRLSGGEKQRVAIARAMSQEPHMLLADEPVASLDPELAWQVMSDLARVAREDQVLTVISIHQVELAKAFADRIIGIARGEVVFDGPPAQLDQATLDRVYRFDKPAAVAVGV